MQDRGVDICDPALQRARSWRWLITRVVGLLQVDTRLRRALIPDDADKPATPQTPTQF